MNAPNSPPNPPTDVVLAQELPPGTGRAAAVAAAVEAAVSMQMLAGGSVLAIESHRRNRDRWSGVFAGLGAAVMGMWTC